jgi:hypothetical protein
MRAFVARFLVIGLFAIGVGGSVAEQVLVCTTDQEIYRPGRPVQIACTNHGDDFVVTGITFQATTAGGAPVYNPAVPAIAVAVPPGESVEHAWDQTFLNSSLGADGEPVPHGRYAVCVRNGRSARFRIGFSRNHLGCASGNDDLHVEGTASMVVWLDLMPTFPGPEDRVHALIDAQFTNLSDEPVSIEIESVVVRREKGGAKLFEFLVTPPIGWDGVLDPGESGGGEWIKTDLLAAGAFECNADVVGILRVAVRPIDDEGAESEAHRGCRTGNLLRIATQPTTLNCVF